MHNVHVLRTICMYVCMYVFILCCILINHTHYLDTELRALFAVIISGAQDRLVGDEGDTILYFSPLVSKPADLHTSVTSSLSPMPRVYCQCECAWSIYLISR